MILIILYTKSKSYKKKEKPSYKDLNVKHKSRYHTVYNIFNATVVLSKKVINIEFRQLMRLETTVRLSCL